jgi:hypothetical protein
VLLSDGLDAHGVGPPLHEEGKGHRAAVGRAEAHVLEAGLDLLQRQVVAQRHQQQLEVVLIQTTGTRAVHFIEHLAQFRFLKQLNLRKKSKALNKLG